MQSAADMSDDLVIDASQLPYESEMHISYDDFLDDMRALARTFVTLNPEQDPDDPEKVYHQIDDFLERDLGFFTFDENELWMPDDLYYHVFDYIIGNIKGFDEYVDRYMAADTVTALPPIPRNCACEEYFALPDDDRCARCRGYY
ncbi:hypothetical protein [Crucivirus-255]|nr:hypothetical protein [Crucivirus-255]